MKKPTAKADRPELPEPKYREPPAFDGFQKVCGDCQHFGGDTTARRNDTHPCHNGISGRLKTRAIDGCAYGFYPNVKRYPIQPGPGGVHVRA